MRTILKTIKNLSPFNNRTEMPKILYILKVFIIFWVFKFGSELIGEAFALAVHFACGKNPLKGEMFDEKTITLLTYFGYSIMIVAVFIFWKLFQKKTLRELGFTRNPVTYLIGMAIGAVLITVSVLPVILSGAIKFNGVFENIDTKMVAVMFPCFILQGMMEEVLCRGVVQQLLISKTSVPVAFGVTAVLFTIPHLSSMAGDAPSLVALGIINLVVISLIFSHLTHRFGSIWAACGLHTVWNYILYNIFGLNLSGLDGDIAAVFNMKSVGSNILNGGDYGIEASIITTAVLAAAFLILSSRKIARRNFSRELKENDVISAVRT